MKILQDIKNDTVVTFNDAIRIVHCALNIELAQLVTILTFEWTSYMKVTKNQISMKFYFVVKNMDGLKIDYNSIT